MDSEWSFVGGHVVLDLVNTAGGATKQRDRELLTGFAVAVAWAEAAGVVDRGEVDELKERARADQLDAETALVELRAQREALHGFLLAGVEQRPCDPTDRERVRLAVTAAYHGARLSERFTDADAWQVGIADAGLRVIGRRLALATGALLAGEHRRQVAVCGRCSWLFLDPSPSRRRRWCSMAACGNRAKAQRHHQRGSVDTAG